MCGQWIEQHAVYLANSVGLFIVVPHNDDDDNNNNATDIDIDIKYNINTTNNDN